MLAYFSYVIGNKLSSSARIAAWLQLLIIVVIALLLVSIFTHSVYASAVLPAIVLGGACGALVKFISEKRNLERARLIELILRNSELQEMRLQLVKQDEVDRRLLAADLHDQVLNDLKSLKRRIADLQSSIDSGVVAELTRLTEKAVIGVRAVMDNLSPHMLEHLGLSAAIEDCLRAGCERGGYALHYKCEVETSRLEQIDFIQQTLLYRLIQECTNNIVKHAGATKVKGSLTLVNDHLVLRVQDNGRGMALNNGSDATSRGLQYMRQRADLIGATIAWLPGENDKGTIVEIRLPVNNKNGSEQSIGSETATK